MAARTGGAGGAAEEEEATPTIITSARARKPDVFDSEGFQAVPFINQIYPDGALRPALGRLGLVSAPITRRAPDADADHDHDGVALSLSSLSQSSFPTTPCNKHQTEASMGDLDKFMRLLRRQIRAVDREIVSCVRAQSAPTALGAAAAAAAASGAGGGGAASATTATTATTSATAADAAGATITTTSPEDLSNTNINNNSDSLAGAERRAAELARRVAVIQRRAADAEQLVQEICRDVRRLDRAKRHLTSAVTSLRRLAMLTAAVEDLEAASARRDSYRRCANLLEAVAQLQQEHFAAYEADVPRIRSLAERVKAAQLRLTDAALDDFRLLLGAADAPRVTPELAERLQGACAVVSALGPRVRDRLMDWLSEREMGVYSAVFSASATDARMLDRFERRYTWYRQRLEEKAPVWEAIFPASWRVPQTLALAFCKVTKAALARLLSDTPREAWVGAEGVAPLIRAVVATNKFEREMAAKFGGGGVGGGDGETGEGEGGDGTGGEGQRHHNQAHNDDDSLPASEARRRLEVYRRRQQAEKAAADAADKAAAAAAAAAEPGASPTAAATAAAAEREAAAAAQAAAAAAAVRVAFEGSISDAFEGGALLAYVDEEERELMAHLQLLIRQEHERRWLPLADEDAAARDAAALMGASARAAEEAASAQAHGAAGTVRVLSSANQLFLKVRASLTRCTRLVSRGGTLVALSAAFRRVLTAYSAELSRRLPVTTSGQQASAALAPSGGAFPLGSSEWHLRLPDSEEAVVGCILHTAEYCRETAEALGAAIAREARPAALGSEVDFSDEAAAFVSLASQCLSVLVLGLSTRLDAGLVEMGRARWDAGLEGGGGAGGDDGGGGMGPGGGGGGPGSGGPGSGRGPARGAAHDESPFAVHIRRTLSDAALRLGPLLDRPQLGFLCDKLARAFAPRFVAALYHLRKPLGDPGLQQLAVDVDAVRRALLDFPRAARLAAARAGPGGALASASVAAATASAEASADAASFLRLAEREMGTAVALVKALQARPEHLPDAYVLLMPASLQTPAEFARVCEARGFTRKLAMELCSLYASAAAAAARNRGGGGGSAAAAASAGGGGVVGPPPASPRPALASSAAAYAAAAVAATAAPASMSPTAAARQQQYCSVGGWQQQQQQEQQQQQQPGRRPGGGESSGGGLAGPAAGGLAALKLSVNSFTRELASSMSGVGARAAHDGSGGGAGGGSFSAAAAGASAGVGSQQPPQQQLQQQQSAPGPNNKLLAEGKAGLQAASARLGQFTSNLASRLGGE
jgi:vacuolar protein sorting-associated protein 53